MKVPEFLKVANRKTSVKTQKLVDLKSYFLAMERVYLMYLYDKSYIGDPTVFDEKQIYGNIVELDIRGMFNIYGQINLTPDQVEYALYVNKENEEAVEFLTILLDLLKYRCYKKEIDSIYDEYNFGVTTKQKMSLNMHQSAAMIKSKLGYDLSVGTLSCFISYESMVAYTDINSYLWELAMGELNIPKEEWSIDGLFDQRLTHDEELKCMVILLDGNVKVTGRYSERLMNWLFSHKWEQGGMTINKKGLYSYLFSAHSEELLALLSKKITELQEGGKNVLAISGNKVYYEEKPDTYKIPVGCFTVLDPDDEILFDGNNMNGFTGEALPHNYLLEEGISFVGCPIELNYSFKERIRVYDLEQCDVKYNSWFKDNPEYGSFAFCEDGEEQELSNPFDEESLEHQMFEIYRNSLKGELIGYVDGKYTKQDIDSAKRAVMKFLQGGRE